MRKYIRIYNGEIQLNFKENLTQTKKNEAYEVTEKELYFIIKSLIDKDNYLYILLIYFLYFAGLNFSFISRIMIKNLNFSFSKLSLKKGTKNIKHHFPPIITNLLFLYYKNARTFCFKYYFNDNILGKIDESRVVKKI